MSWVAWCKTLGLGHVGALSALFSAQYSIPCPPGKGPIVMLRRCVQCEEPPCRTYVESVPSLLPGRGAPPRACFCSTSAVWPPAGDRAWGRMVTYPACPALACPAAFLCYQDVPHFRTLVFCVGLPDFTCPAPFISTQGLFRHLG